MSYLGMADKEEFYLDIVGPNCDIDFYYKGEQYMISSEWFGSRRHKYEKKCFSYIGGTDEEWKESLQQYDSWEELLENAYFKDGVKIKDVAEQI